MDPVLPPLLVCAFLAGFVDAVAGGGGLVQLPALFVCLPTSWPALVLGTNKLAAFAGTLAAAGRYAGAVTLDWEILAPGAASAMAGAFLGARATALVRPEWFRPLVLVLLCLVGAYTCAKKDLGARRANSAPFARPAARVGGAVLVGATIGFYDGFLGPGTGSWLLFAFVTLFGEDFLRASAVAKLINCGTNLAALVFFVGSGNVLYRVAIPMAACNVAGSLLGARIAIRRGSRFVRTLFLGVVGAVVCRFAWEVLGPRL